MMMLGSVPRTGPELRVGDCVTIQNVAQNLNGTVGEVTRVTPHTVWVYFMDATGHSWDSPHRPWQVRKVEAQESASTTRRPYSPPAVASCALYGGAAAAMRFAMACGDHT